MQARKDELNVKTESPDALRNQTFSRLLTANHSRLRAFIYALVHDHHHTDDLMQEVAVVLWKRYDTFEEGTNFAAWAMKIARYTVLNWRRTQNKLPLLLDDDEFSLLADAATTAASKFDTRSEALANCLGQLGEEQQSLIKARYTRSVPVEQIAESLGRSRRAIYKSLSKIHQALSRCIDKRLAGETNR